MEGRGGMAVSGSAPYYLHRGVGGSGGSGSTHTGFDAQDGFTFLSNLNVPIQSIDRSGGPAGSTLNVEGSPANFPQGFTVSMPFRGSLSEPLKKKRGRPRKYGPAGAGSRVSEAGAVSLGKSPMSSPNSITPAEKQRRGRPPGSGRKQQLANVGNWMYSSAGIAFTPHVIYVASGEDIAAKILSFSQQKPRAICIMSASGGVSAVTLRQPASSGRNVTYEGCFEILCLSGSYLVAETGGSDNRTGGVNVALSSPDGHVIGGALGGRLIASRPVQVVISSFLYGRSSSSRTESGILPTDSGQANVSPGRNFSPATGVWSGSEAMDPKNPNTDINLMYG